jgi:hypothetical protein
MTTFQVPGPTLDANMQSSTTPLVVLFERDDAIAVPLLSQLRIAGYDVRAARTPVELFDITSKHVVSLILIDMGSATAGRREFWVALDTQRRGRPIQLMTFRYTVPGGILETDFEPVARAIADVEVRGAHEFQFIVDMVRQRVPLIGPAPAAPGLYAAVTPGIAPPLGGSPQPGGIAPIGAALGIPSPFMSQQPVMFGVPGTSQGIDGLDLFGGASDASSPFAHPATSNPFGPGGAGAGTSLPTVDESPFAQPYSSNPFAAATPNIDSQQPETMVSHAFSYQAPTNPPMGTFEERAARLSNAYAAEFGIADTPSHTPSLAAADYAFSDAWTPPGGDDLFAGPPASSGAPSPAAFAKAKGLSDTGAFTATEYAPALVFDHLPLAARAAVDPATMQTAAVKLPTSPEPSKAKLRPPLTPQEESLGSVLVEGALLSEQKLEALQDMQQMLANANMDYKLGELALLFKFLSPDQLLAALLVSRGLVSPQQIANLGRTKQDLANSGMDYNLADLLTMFHVLPEEQVRQICQEIAS